MWTLPSGGIEPGEVPTTAAARELAEESGCIVDPAELHLISTVAVVQDGQQASQSWNFTAIVTDPHLEPADPDGTVVDAHWFSREQATELLAQHSYDPIREPALRFLGDGTATHWTFDLVGTGEDGRPRFTWARPTSSRLDG